MIDAIKHAIKHEIKHGRDSCLIQEGDDGRAAGLGVSKHHRERDADLHRGRSRLVALVAMEEEVMAEKWTIRALTPDEYPDTQLRYEVRDETDVVSLHDWEEDAKQMAAVPLLRDALFGALAFIEEVARDFGVVPEEDVLERITAALEAAKGE